MEAPHLFPRTHLFCGSCPRLTVQIFTHLVVSYIARYPTAYRYLIPFLTLIFVFPLIKLWAPNSTNIVFFVLIVNRIPRTQGMLRNGPINMKTVFRDYNFQILIIISESYISTPKKSLTH